MQKLRRRVPNLTALAFFEAAGRHMSFTRVAEEFHITQGAVSRQIRLLEESLGVTLFERLHRAIALTDEGRQFHRAVAMALEHVEAATDSILEANHFTIAATHAVSTYWLMPRIGQLRNHFPNLDVQVLATDADLSEVSGSFDIAIQYGDGQWPEFETMSLGTSEVFPVCSPQFAASHQIKAVTDLLTQPLLYLNDDRQTWVDWPFWFHELGLTGPYPRPAIRANSYMILQQAAINGQGVALGWQHLVYDALCSGALVNPIAMHIESPQGFYLTINQKYSSRIECDALIEWFIAEFRESTRMSKTKTVT